jgi:uncharacterized membrane protein
VKIKYYCIQMNSPFSSRITFSAKYFLLILFVFIVSDSFASGPFTSQFSRNDLLFVLIIAALVIGVLWVLKSSMKALQKTSDAGNNPERISGLVEDIKQTRSVIFYCTLIFLFFYISYAFVKGTSMESHVTEWLNLLVRWTHVVFGIAWIGASFYFNFLENSLNRTTDLKEGIAGNLWAIHGGGFYYLEKYKVAPPEIPKHLHWFKYEAYFTWLSGFTLLVIVYYLDAKVYLIDTNVMDLTPAAAIGIGIGTLVAGWLVYDTLCKSVLVKTPVILSIILFLFTTGVAWFLSHVFSSRAAYIHVGAMLGTLMAANVFRVIIPAQKAMVAAARAGQPVDPSLGKNALLRSRHNNYFTLPVIFIMISNHFPSTYGGIFNWSVLIGLSVVSVLVKHYLNLMEKGEKAVWILPVAVLGMIALAFVTAPHTKSVCKDNSPATLAEVHGIIVKRCVQCHSANPTDDVLKVAPNGISFDDPKSLVKYSERILSRAVITKTMPQGNKTHITQDERDLIQCWIEHGSKE